MIVTIDGPAGAGKSTVAREVAARLGWCYLDTGAMYRAGRVLLEGRDISAAIRSEQITSATRPVADAPPVRAAMVRLQQQLAAGRDVVTEGRDQGSVVFPDASLKVFLTASPAERARRRHREEASRGTGSTLERVLAEQTSRDEGDRRRPVGAMRPAADAVLLETDGLSAAEVVDRLLAMIAERRQRGVT